MVAYLAVLTGPEKGRQYQLDVGRPMHIGRGGTCDIILRDPVGSRFHAVVYFEDDNWHVSDTSSRNGTLVNGQKIDSARLLDQAVICIGSTELLLVENDSDAAEDELQTQWISSALLDPDEWQKNQQAFNTSTFPSYLSDLYQLSLHLLSDENSEEVLDTTLELLKDRTGADVVALSASEPGARMETMRIQPSDCRLRFDLPKSTVNKIVKDDQAVWLNRIDDSIAAPKLTDSTWSDSIYVPVSADVNIGILHLHRHESAFQEIDFDLATAAGRLIGIGQSRLNKNTQLRNDHQRLAERSGFTDELIGESPPMQKLKAKIVRVGKANGAVLIRGESGAGKELVARAVHRASPRANRPMLTVNCAAIPRDLIESQLFGHKKGAFTGADNDHVGWFEQSHLGTLFLDEIGELTLEGQAKLLRILEGHPFLPVGATQEVRVDVRVVAATNRDLAEFVREKKFREDLFYRLSVFELLVPPLRERGDDIDLLSEHFFEHFRRESGRLELKFSTGAREALRNYVWPGNVRQLRNVIDSAVVMADDPAIESADLGLRDAGVSQLDTLRINVWEERLIKRALDRTGGSIPEASKLLGISRATAYRKITEYDIER